MSKKSFNKELRNAAEKNSVITKAIDAGKNVSFVSMDRETRTGKIKTVPGIMFTDGRLFALRNSRFTCNLSPVCVSDNMTGKMLNIASVSTSVLLNEYCNIRRNNPAYICFDCFAAATVDKYSDLEKNLSSNTALLMNYIIPDDLIPVFITDVVRFESFGDLNNIIQFINYIKIAVYNPKVYFTLWTKNAFIVRFVKRIGIAIPKNLHLIKSSPAKDKPHDNPEPEIFDAVFTVYTPAYLNAHGYNESNFINCGGRSCRSCMNCYGKRIKNPVINEKQK